jgi:hypothetical protein
MSAMKRWTMAVAIMVMSFFAGSLLQASLVSADDGAAKGSGGCNAHFLTFPAWYDGLTDGKCNIQAPSGGAVTLSAFIWRIVLNIIDIVLQLMGYIAAGFILFGGFRYVTSSGLPEKTVRARKTILNAVIGLVISFMSVVIVTLIANGLTETTATCPPKTSSVTDGKADAACLGVAKVSADSAINGILNTVYYAGGVAAVIVIIISAILYTISQGDAAKTKRAKDGILYAVVGLVVIMMAFVITNFIIGRF